MPCGPLPKLEPPSISATPRSDPRSFGCASRAACSPATRRTKRRTAESRKRTKSRPMTRTWFDWLREYQLHSEAMQAAVVGTMLEIHSGENYLKGLSPHERAAVFWWVIERIETE